MVGDGDASPLDGRHPRRRCSATTSCSPRRAPPASSSPRSTNAPPRRCVTRAAPPATRRVSSTRTARRSCTRWRRAPERGGATPTDDRMLPIVPMFHANAWGTPYAAWMAGADLLMPGPLPAGEPLAQFIEQERPDLRVRGAHDLDRPPPLRRRPPRRPLVAARGHRAAARRCRGALMEAFEERFGIRILQGWGMTETSPLAAVASPPRGVEPGTVEEIDWRASDRPRHPRRRAAHRRRRRHRAAVGRRRGRRDPGARAVGHRRRTTAIPRPRSSTTAGCAPATSPASPPTATSRSPTAPRTSSSRAASGSRRSSSRGT